MCATRGSFCERLAARNGSSDAAAIVCAQRIKFFQKRKILREKSVINRSFIFVNTKTIIKDIIKNAIIMAEIIKNCVFKDIFFFVVCIMPPAV